MTNRQVGNLEGIFHNPNEAEKMRELFAKFIEPYVDQYVFDTSKEALAELMLTPKRAYLMSEEGLNNYPEYRCHVATAWKTR